MMSRKADRSAVAKSVSEAMAWQYCLRVEGAVHDESAALDPCGDGGHVQRPDVEERRTDERDIVVGDVECENDRDVVPPEVRVRERCAFGPTSCPRGVHDHYRVVGMNVGAMRARRR
jgi:hypothetical protein